MTDLIHKYVWLVDILSRFTKLNKEEINNLYSRSRFSKYGERIPDRTFYYFRRGVEESFHIKILCDRLGYYYLDPDSLEKSRILTNWLIENHMVEQAVKDSGIPQDRIVVEEVPSARQYLETVMKAIGSCSKLSFTYAGFSRTMEEKEIVFHPYFVKRYKQRWYMIGLREKSGDIRTYALDRIKKLEKLNFDFKMPDITPEPFFSNLIGITESKGRVHTVRIMTSPVQAKYLRALPLHSTQEETLNDNYSIFTYKLKLNYELVHELLSYGSSVKVLDPPELVLMVRNELEDTIHLYTDPKAIPTNR